MLNFFINISRSVRTISLNIKNNNILSENAFLRYITFSSLYFAQGIPEGLTFFALPAWLAANGKSTGEIGTFMGVIAIPWSFKILIAPLMDRFTYLPMGRKRPWVIVGQLGLIISLISTAFINDPLNNLNILMVAGFSISLFGAFQDVAVDGMAISNLGRAMGSGYLGELKDFLIDWKYVITVYALVSLIMFLLLRKINFREQLLRIEILESNNSK